jgi:hypothetical protein
MDILNFFQEMLRYNKLHAVEQIYQGRIIDLSAINFEPLVPFSANPGKKDKFKHRYTQRADYVPTTS